METRIFSYILLGFFALISTQLTSAQQYGPDTVYVWCYDGNIQKFGANGTQTITNLSSWNGPVGLTVDDAGNLYTGSPCDSVIRRIDPSGKIAIFGLVDSVSAMAFDDAGHLFVTAPNYCEILRSDYNPYSQSHLNYPISLAFDGLGLIYVANGVSPLWTPPGIFPVTNTVEVFSPDLTHLGTFATNMNQPWGLAFDRAGNLFVSNAKADGSLSKTIVKITPDGSCMTFASATNGLNNPRGLAFDSDGNLYVANFGNGNILRFGSNGVCSVFATGLTNPCSIAIYPGIKVSPANLQLKPTLQNGALQFDFTGPAGLSFSLLESTNISSTATNWVKLGGASEISPGRYQLIDSNLTNSGRMFYRVSAP